jgi:hypothetical protein
MPAPVIAEGVAANAVVEGEVASDFKRCLLGSITPQQRVAIQLNRDKPAADRKPRRIVRKFRPSQPHSEEKDAAKGADRAENAQKRHQ